MCQFVPVKYGNSENHIVGNKIFLIPSLGKISAGFWNMISKHVNIPKVILFLVLKFTTSGCSVGLSPCSPNKLYFLYLKMLIFCQISRISTSSKLVHGKPHKNLEKSPSKNKRKISKKPCVYLVILDHSNINIKISNTWRFQM